MEYTYYIGIGSNLGFRHDNILKSVFLMKTFISEKACLSSLYTSKPQGFSSRNKFLNAVLEVKSPSSPDKILEILRKTEHLVCPYNTKRTQKGNYHDRYIDLDILFYDGPPVISDHLTIPHPKLTERDFALLPLLELNSALHHPLTGTPLQNYLRKKNSLKIWKQAGQKIVCVEGNIGAGKTTLIRSLNIPDSIRIFEEFHQNPWLKKFYAFPEKFAFRTEKWFLKNRTNTWSRILPTKSRWILSDYVYLKTLVFAETNLNPSEKEKFLRLWNQSLFHIPQPDLIIYIHRPVPKLLHHISQRNRIGEKAISPQYLETIHMHYLELFQKFPHIPVKKISGLKTDEIIQLLRKM